MKAKYHIQRNILYQKYKVEKLSLTKCAKFFKCSTSPIRRLLRTYKISFNSRSEMAKKRSILKGNKNPKWKRIEMKCAWCGKIVVRKRCYKAKKTFCSQKCRGKWLSTLLGKKNPNYNSQVVKCDWCGKKIVKNLYRIKHHKHHFCCRKHNGLWKAENLRGKKVYNWKGGYDSYYGENWLVQRRKALGRDNYTCQDCRKTTEDLKKNPDVHHKTPFREFGLKNYQKANSLNNLISLCASCHSKQHNNIS